MGEDFDREKNGEVLSGKISRIKPGEGSSYKQKKYENPAREGMTKISDGDWEPGRVLPVFVNVKPSAGAAKCLGLDQVYREHFLQLEELA